MLITIFTPTYNRQHTLPRLYQSLCIQKFRDFEWLVVDDGSTDSTEEIIQSYIQQNKIPIRYIKKVNGGKHTAYNVGLDEARGDLFFCVDSDDWLQTNALEYIYKSFLIFGKIPHVIGMIALKALSNGNIIGCEFIESNITSTFANLEKSKQGGERSLIFFTKIAQRIKFPIFEQEKFMPECVVYDKFFNEKFYIKNYPLTICEYQEDGLSSNPKSLILQNPIGYALYYKNRIDMNVPLYKKITYIIKYNILMTSVRRKDLLKYDGVYKLLVLIIKIANPIFSFIYKRSAS